MKIPHQGFAEREVKALTCGHLIAGARRIVRVVARTVPLQACRRMEELYGWPRSIPWALAGSGGCTAGPPSSAHRRPAGKPKHHRDPDQPGLHRPAAPVRRGQAESTARILPDVDPELQRCHHHSQSRRFHQVTSVHRCSGSWGTTRRSWPGACSRTSSRGGRRPGGAVSGPGPTVRRTIPAFECRFKHQDGGWRYWRTCRPTWWLIRWSADHHQLA